MYATDNQIAARFAVSRQTIWRWTRDGDFPAPVKLVGSTRWRIADVEQWEASHQPAAAVGAPRRIVGNS